jgi:HAE1 family hydrophobic/amphiphilic exporter-1
MQPLTFACRLTREDDRGSEPRAVGTPVFYGMPAAAAIGVFVIPMLYMVLQWMREKTGWKPAQAVPAPAQLPAGE